MHGGKVTVRGWRMLKVLPSLTKPLAGKMRNRFLPPQSVSFLFRFTHQIAIDYGAEKAFRFPYLKCGDPYESYPSIG